MNAVLQKPRAQTSSGASSASDLASAHGRSFALRTSQFDLRRRRSGAATVLDSDFSSDADGISDVENPYTFTARRLDAESGLMQYRNRYYGPGLGRFLSTDPFDHASTTNAFAYVDNIPVRSLDPLGLMPIWYPSRHDGSLTGTGGPAPSDYPGPPPPDIMFRGCTSSQEGKLKRAKKGACENLEDGLRRLTKLRNDPAAVCECVAYPDTRDSWHKIRDHIPDLIKKLKKAKRKTCDGIVEFVCHSASHKNCAKLGKDSTGTQAWVSHSVFRGTPSWEPIHICPRFFANNATERRDSVLHEITHYSGIRDREPAWNDPEQIVRSLNELRNDWQCEDP